MWLNCNNSLVALDKICFIEFSYDEDNTPTASIYFTGRRRPHLIQSDNMEDLIGYFHGCTIEKGVKNDPATGSHAEG